MILTLYCCMCSRKLLIELASGDWAVDGEDVDYENAFCPEHQLVKEWSDKCCPGCVGGWGECGLWKMFAYGGIKLTDKDLDAIRSGTCPKRVNGTMEMGASRRLEPIDISETATTQSGEAFVDAILKYVKAFARQV